MIVMIMVVLGRGLALAFKGIGKEPPSGPVINTHLTEYWDSAVWRVAAAVVQGAELNSDI